MERAILEGTTDEIKLRSNITINESNAIKALKCDKSIVIFQADKGAAVVVQNRKDYLNEAYKQLNGKDENDEEVYWRISNDPTSDFVFRVKEAIKDALVKDVIDSGSITKECNIPENIHTVPDRSNQLT